MVLRGIGGDVIVWIALKLVRALLRVYSWLWYVNMVTMVEQEKLNRIHLIFIFTCTRIDGEVMSASI
jgi:hypothetical protein